MANWSIEPLDATHVRGQFNCGRPPLDEFIQRLASQYEKRRLGRTFVALAPGEKTVRGYYTLASSAIPFENIPPKTAQKLPRHPVPVALLGRLAVDQSAQGGGLGGLLLMHALRQCLDAARRLGIFAVEVLAIDEQAMRFYQKHGFVSLPDSELHLFLPIKTIEAVIGE